MMTIVLQRITRPLLLLTLVLLVGACEGPMGPEGPRGPAGIQGPAGHPGPAGSVQLTFQGQLGPDGVAVADLPLAAGTIASAPAFACYLSYLPTGAPTSSTSDDIYWVRIGDDLFAPSTQSCIIATGPNPPALRVVVAGGAPSQGVMVHVFYR